jgi:hypothetical protein
MNIIKADHESKGIILFGMHKACTWRDVSFSSVSIQTIYHTLKSTLQLHQEINLPLLTATYTSLQRKRNVKMSDMVIVDNLYTLLPSSFFLS